jgi:hypothetical protein
MAIDNYQNSDILCTNYELSFIDILTIECTKNRISSDNFSENYGPENKVGMKKQRTKNPCRPGPISAEDPLGPQRWATRMAQLCLVSA